MSSLNANSMDKKPLIFMNDTIRLGSHVGKEKSLTRTVLKALTYHINCAQIYLANSRGYALPSVQDGDINTVRNLVDYAVFPIYVHACLLYNLNGGTNIDVIDHLIEKAKTDKSREKYTNEREKIPINLEKTLDGLRAELDICHRAFGTGVVVHIGSGVDKDKAIPRIAKNIDSVLRENKEWCIILENAAGEGNKIGSTIDEIMHIISLAKHKSQISVCIDTCHLYAAGEYDIENVSEMKRFFSDFIKIAKKYKLDPLPKISLIHLNDSMGEFGCRVDRHQDLGQGYIFASDAGQESLKWLVNYCNSKKIDMILETPGDHFSDIEMVWNMCKKYY